MSSREVVETSMSESHDFNTIHRCLVSDDINNAITKCACELVELHRPMGRAQLVRQVLSRTVRDAVCTSVRSFN